MPVYASLSHAVAEALVDVLWVIEGSGAGWDSPVMTPFAGRVFVGADHLRGRNFEVGPRFDQPQHRAAARGHAVAIRHAGTGPPSRRVTDCGQRRPQPLGPPAIPTGQRWKLFGEGPPPVRDDWAEEPADTQSASDPAASTGHISGKSQEGAVDSPCPAPASGTDGPNHLVWSRYPYRLMFRATDSTATSAIDGNSNSFSLGATSSTGRTVSHTAPRTGPIRETSPVPTHPPIVTQRACSRECEPELRHVHPGCSCTMSPSRLRCAVPG